MPADRVLRFSDYERRSRNPDAALLRDPAEANIIIVLPVVQREADMRDVYTRACDERW